LDASSLRIDAILLWVIQIENKQLAIRAELTQNSQLPRNRIQPT